MEQMAQKSSQSGPLTIGRLACLAQIPADTVRFYERSGLLEAEERTSAGYRLYSKNSIARLQFIRRAREIGYDLDQIREILSLHDSGGTKADVQAFTSDMINDIDDKFRALSKWRQLFLDLFNYFEESKAESINGKTADLLMKSQCDKFSNED
jgi:DNA-binding transcriptional MerR regulator